MMTRNKKMNRKAEAVYRIRRQRVDYRALSDKVLEGYQRYSPRDPYRRMPDDKFLDEFGVILRATAIACIRDGEVAATPAIRYLLRRGCGARAIQAALDYLFALMMLEDEEEGE